MRPECAFVLGAGLGNRLRPLTNERPKPLVPIYGKPLITFAFDHLIGVGIARFVVNTHHRPEAYAQILGERNHEAVYDGCGVQFRHEPVLLDTGGGIRNAADLIGTRDFVVYNGDVLSDLPLAEALDEHKRAGNLATLVLRSTGGPLQVRCDRASGRLTDIRDAIGGRSEPGFLFSGITILSPEIFDEIPDGKAVSIIPIYIDLIRRGARIGGCVADEGCWFDLGTPDAYLGAHEWLAKNSLSHSPANWPCTIDPLASVDASAQLRGFFSVGPGVQVGGGAIVENSVIWENARIAAGTHLDRCVVRDGRHAEGAQQGTII